MENGPKSTPAASGGNAPLLSPSSVTPATSSSLIQTVTAFFGGTDSASIQCQVCLDRVPDAQCTTLSACGHQFCTNCVTMYLEVNIRDGQVYPKCFHEDDAVADPTDHVRTVKTCGTPIAPADIELLVSAAIRTKYDRFRFNKENAFGRQCPYCAHSQRCEGPTNPDCHCEQCGKPFCFLHANAHDDQSCATYEKQQTRREHDTRAVIQRIAKECPRCKIKIEKNGGCNHLKCLQCGTSFCWMCGAEVDDADLPNHFQWWNLSGCAGLMQAQIRQDTRLERAVAKMLSLLNFVLIGPASFVVTVALTIATLGCMPCLCVSDVTFGEFFLLGMELVSCILLLPVSLTVRGFTLFRRCIRKRDRSLEVSSREPHDAETDPAEVV